MNIVSYLGFGPDEAMAFGDGGNDIPMIQRAGIGIAMGNGNQGLKNVLTMSRLPSMMMAYTEH